MAEMLEAITVTQITIRGNIIGAMVIEKNEQYHLFSKIKSILVRNEGNKTKNHIIRTFE